MKLKGQFLLDYETLFVNHSILNDLHDCLIVIPYSSFTIFNQAIKDALTSNELTVEEKELVKSTYKPFVDLIFKNTTILNQITKERKSKSDTICINAMNCLFLCFTNTEKESSLNIPLEVIETLDTVEYDVLAASKKYNCPILTSNKAIIELIVNNKLSVDYIELID